MQIFSFCSLIIINNNAPFFYFIFFFFVELLEKMRTKGYRGLEKYLSKTILMYCCGDGVCFSWIICRTIVYQVLI